MKPRSSSAPRGARKAPIEFVKANPRNPRRNFSDEELDELAASIKERGIIQPIVVRAIKGTNDQFEIVAGERRWRAAQRAGLHEVPIITVEVTDAEALELAIIENVQRADLNPLEEAMGYQSLIDEYKHSQNDVAQVRRQEPQPRRQHAAAVAAPGRGEGLHQLRPAYRRSRARADRPAERRRAGARHRQPRAQRAPGRGADAARATARAGEGGEGQSRRKDADTMALERRVSDALGLNVTIEHRGKGGVVHDRLRRPRADGRACCGGWSGNVAATTIRCPPRRHRHRQQQPLHDRFGEVGVEARLQASRRRSGRSPLADARPTTRATPLAPAARG